MGIGQTCSNIEYPKIGWLMLKNTRLDDNFWIQRPCILTHLHIISIWFHLMVLALRPVEKVFSTSQHSKSKSQTSGGSCCKTKPNPPIGLDSKPRSGHKEQVTRHGSESFPVLCIALSGTHQFLALAPTRHGAS